MRGLGMCVNGRSVGTVERCKILAWGEPARPRYAFQIALSAESVEETGLLQRVVELRPRPSFWRAVSANV